MSTRRAIFWSVFWIVLSLLLNGAVFLLYGHQKAAAFFTGYIIEKSLSVDNLFVFLMIFTFFDVSSVHQRRILNYGIIGVIILRGLLIFAGASLVERFEWIFYIFGAILIYSGYTMAFGKERRVEPEHNLILKLFKKFIPVKNAYTGDHFFLKEEGVLYATPMIVVLIVIETTDVIFAIDSIPAIFGITTDPFIVFSSNLMAVLGLRSLYFVLERVQRAFVYVKYGVGVVLSFIGVKMLIADYAEISTLTSLAVVVSILTASVLLSYIKRAVTGTMN
ncbi:MAG: TerC/Alx family metal homeostasis membrane protein [Bacteroidota bacterium]|nr:TerC/Alx family metal homeostasis membrane protein [Bacteroidota bacterium]